MKLLKQFLQKNKKIVFFHFFIYLFADHRNPWRSQASRNTDRYWHCQW